MKRLIVLALVCSFVLSAAVASAVDVKTSGNVLTNFVWRSNWDFNDEASDRTSFEVFQRSDLYFTATANENLKGVIGLRATRDEWGDDGFAMGNPGSSTDGTAETFGIRDLYIDFNWPGTAVNAKIGIQSVTLPNAIGGSFLQDERGGAVMVSTDFTDNVGVLAGWSRLDNTSAARSGAGESEIDAWILALPLTFEGFSVTPFGAFVPMGDEAIALESMQAVNASTTGNDEYDDAYWLGLSMTMDMFDPFVFKADINYGNVSGDETATSNNDRSGWLAAAALEYTGFDFMTPEVYFVYTTGEDGNGTDDLESERLPTLAQDWAVGSFFFGGESITAAALDNGTAQNGFWLIGLDLKDIQSFAEGLSHNLHIFYAQGTNDEDINAAGVNTTQMVYGRTLTEEDSLIEISSTTAYEIYDALTLYVDLGYINLDADDDVWTGAGQDGGDAWKFATGMVFKF